MQDFWTMFLVCNSDKVFEQDSGKQSVVENSPAEDKATRQDKGVLTLVCCKIVLDLFMT